MALSFFEMMVREEENLLLMAVKHLEAGRYKEVEEDIGALAEILLDMKVYLELPKKARDDFREMEVFDRRDFVDVYLRERSRKWNEGHE